MTVREAQDAMATDFRRVVTRPDLLALSDEYRPRPGLYLADIVGELRHAEQSAIVFNGNNVGWWGNQFIIRRGQLRFKAKGPIFDDGHLADHASGKHAFFVAGPTGFDIVDIPLEGRRRVVDDTVEMDLRPLCSLPPCGLSGFPLIRRGREVWEECSEHAWDPGLLFNLRPSPKDRALTIRTFVRYLIDAREELARHSLTAIGLNDDRDIVLLVVEKSDRSRGMTVAEAANLLRRRFATSDAIVLGAAGDAQLATTAEGFLTLPLVAPYAQLSARMIPNEILSSELGTDVAFARPVPCYVLLRPSVDDSMPATLPLPHVPSPLSPS